MKSFSADFFRLYTKLLNGKNFAFTRFSDGEMFIMQNLEVTLDNKLTKVGETLHGCHYPKLDHKTFLPDNVGHQEFRGRLWDAYKHHQDGYYVGLSCPCCVGESANQWMKDNRKDVDEFTTWANLFVNANYPLFLEYFLPIIENREIVLIAHESFDKRSTDLKIMRHFPIGYNAMINDLHLIDEIGEYIGNYSIKNTLFLFSASSLSNILIHELYKKFPDNTYLDIGTTLHHQFGMELARDYLKAYWIDNTDHPDLHKVCRW